MSEENEDSKVKGAIYYRRDTVESDERIEEQTKRLEDFANENNIKICKNYYDLGTSKHKPSLNKLFEDIEKENIKTVIMESLLTLTRDMYELKEYFENVFDKNEVRCIGVLDGFDSEKDKSLVENNKALIERNKKMLEEYGMEL